MVVIKHIPEDFVVEEITSVELNLKTGKYAYFWLEKRNYNTIDAVKAVAKAMHVPHKNIGFAGSKDRRAVTRQLCSVLNAGRKKIENIKHGLKDIKIEFAGYGEGPVSLGCLKGNSFRITARNLGKEETAALKKNASKNFSIVNYYDEQRFSSANVDVGRAIIRGEFGKAAEIISENKWHSNEGKAANKNDYNEKVSEYLINNKTNYVGALSLVPKKILTFFVNSYQSWLWNECAAEYVKLKAAKTKSMKYSRGEFVFGADSSGSSIKNVKIPLLGFGTKLEEDEVGKIYEIMIKAEKISLRDFIIKSMPELSSEGSERSLLAEIKDMKHRISNDEFYKDGRKAELEFSLPPGSYATLVVKWVLSD